ncbi:heavy-metal-associated domain-containing protein [Kitasatospora cathayae]|uniref:Cation transporter n=1 Tax=Kitasatospora cathayae TaxID=3004092 RepID=A0ABY7QBR9_9ACTN|nr:cation transporter [Kitasatospora sp. HUAS 3-15]WBP89981.1 cation transporter [Kitasatospora sp. HUAS 3-15]
MSETTVTVDSSSAEGSCCGSCGTGVAKAPATAAVERAVFQVKGMTCGHCVSSVTDELKKVAGVTEVAVDLATGQVTVDSTRPLADTDVAAAIDEAGYDLIGRLGA